MGVAVYLFERQPEFRDRCKAFGNLAASAGTKIGANLAELHIDRMANATRSACSPSPKHRITLCISGNQSRAPDGTGWCIEIFCHVANTQKTASCLIAFLALLSMPGLTSTNCGAL